MNYLKTLSLVVCMLTILNSCSRNNYPINDLKKQLVGEWKLVSYGGGFANLPETETKDNIRIEFTAANIYRNFTDDVLKTETEYAIKYVESAVFGTKQYVIVLKDEEPYIRFTVSDTELVLSGDHVDALYFKYKKI